MARRRSGPPAPRKPKGITPEFEDEIIRAGADQVKNMIVTRNQQLQETAVFLSGLQDNDGSREIKRLKGALSILTGPANETKTVLNNQNKALLKRLAELGG